MIYPFINMGLKFPEACFILPFLESQTCIVKFVLNIWGGVILLSIKTLTFANK